VLHQQPVDKDVAAANFAQENAFSAVVEDGDQAEGQRVVTIKEPAEGISSNFPVLGLPPTKEGANSIGHTGAVAAMQGHPPYTTPVLLNVRIDAMPRIGSLLWHKRPGDEPGRCCILRHLGTLGGFLPLQVTTDSSRYRTLDASFTRMRRLPRSQ
jgi:hypothetical protein